MTPGSVHTPTRLTAIITALSIMGTHPAAAEWFSLDDYHRVDKIDVHFHIRSEAPEFVEFAKQDRFRFVNIATYSANPDEMRLRHRAAFAQQKAHPDRVIVASSFPMDGWDDPDWQARTIQYLDETFASGAVAVKLWKNIGMESKDQHGQLIMVDDPQLRPVIDHIAKKGIRLIGHLGEPRECWLPAERMVIHRGYYVQHPEYHMFLHPRMPTYEDQLAARDRMLAQHLDVKFCAAHLASLEWSVDELARFLDRFPMSVAETAARVADLQFQSSQDHAKVRDFLVKYQDRILYATDMGVAADENAADALVRVRKRWLADWTYFATDSEVNVPQLASPVRGLQLPADVIEKIYRTNAERFFDNSWKDGRENSR
jgi:hypothetical protein